MLRQAIFDLDRSAAIKAMAFGKNPMEALEYLIRSRDVRRLVFTLQLLTPGCLQAVRLLALQLYMMGNFPVERRELKKWIFEIRAVQRRVLQVHAKAEIG